MKKRKSHPRIGGDFEDFLRDEGRLEEATAVAIKRVLAWEIQRAMDSAGVSQAEMARRMFSAFWRMDPMAYGLLK